MLYILMDFLLWKSLRIFWHIYTEMVLLSSKVCCQNFAKIARIVDPVYILASTLYYYLLSSIFQLDGHKVVFHFCSHLYFFEHK